MVRHTALLTFACLLSVTLRAQAWALPPPKVGGSRRRGAFAFERAQPVRRQMEVALPSSSALLVSGGGSDPSEVPAEDTAKATISQSVFNLVKNIMGAGMLSLPAGVAAFSDAKNAIVPASAIVLVLGALSGYTFSLIGRCCSETKAESYEQSWARSVSDKTGWLPAGACVSMCFAACLAFTLIMGDTFSTLLKTVNAPLAVSRRSSVIAALSGVVLLPLCLLKNLSALGFTSMLGTSGLMYTAAMMGVRFFDGSYAPGGRFHAMLMQEGAAVPAFGLKKANPLLFLVLVCMLSTAYGAHFNAPLFYRELKNNTMKRYNTVVGASFLVSFLTMLAVTSFGFLTFGGSSAGYILNNYASKDFLANLARVFVGFSIVFSYPLCFVGLRDGILEMRGVTKPSNRARTLWTAGLVTLSSGIAMFLTDLGFVNAFAGALIASGLIYIFPALMFVSNRKRAMKDGKMKNRKEVLFNQGVLTFGIVMAAVGAVVSVLQSFFPHVLGM